MKKHGLMFMAAICALAAAATPAIAAGGTSYLSRTGSGSTCSLAAPCANMDIAVSAAGANGEVICLDKSNYGPVDAFKIGNSQITSNVNGLNAGGSGQILTLGGNQLHSNVSDGSFTGSIATQ